MRVIDRSEFRDDLGEISFANRLRGSLRYGLSWYGIIKAQEVVSERLAKSLPNEYHLLRNVLVPGSGAIISLILLAPQGAFTLLPSPARGVFRAKDEEWLTQSGGRFRPARPNLQQLSLASSQLLLQYFRGLGYDLPQVEPVLVFTNPAAHVDTVHPATRIVLADAIEHFAGGLRERPPIMDREDVQLLLEALLNPPQPETPPEPEPAPPPRPPTPAQRPAAADQGAGPFGLDQRQVPERLRPRRRRARLQRRQVMLLALMLLVEVCILAAFAALILFPDLLNLFG
jgi:hypothetical protein